MATDLLAILLMMFFPPALSFSAFASYAGYLLERNLGIRYPFIHFPAAFNRLC